MSDSLLDWIDPSRDLDAVEDDMYAQRGSDELVLQHDFADDVRHAVRGLLFGILAGFGVSKLTDVDPRLIIAIGVVADPIIFEIRKLRKVKELKFLLRR